MTAEGFEKVTDVIADTLMNALEGISVTDGPMMTVITVDTGMEVKVSGLILLLLKVNDADVNDVQFPKSVIP